MARRRVFARETPVSTGIGDRGAALHLTGLASPWLPGRETVVLKPEFQPCGFSLCVGAGAEGPQTGKLCGESRGLSELRRGRERLADRTCPCSAELVKKNHPRPVVVTLKAF